MPSVAFAVEHVRIGHSIQKVTGSVLVSFDLRRHALALLEEHQVFLVQEFVEDVEEGLPQALLLQDAGTENSREALKHLIEHILDFQEFSANGAIASVRANRNRGGL